VSLLPDLSPATVGAIAARVRATKGPGDAAVASIHWGSNWGYQVPRAQVECAHALIEETRVDVVRSRSSHHAKAIAIPRGRPILFACGDFLNDYEGIPGYEEFQNDLAVIYLPTLEAGIGRPLELRLEVFRLRNFRLKRAPHEDVR
jgi:poly-gamma-glutamate capsule biosynthesis protein CapA/YwtB (metallophosphatase superfamily)